jgi:hypothetical protein
MSIGRRDIIFMLCGVAVACPIARAQQRGSVANVGILAMQAWPPIDTFREALNDLGYVHGKDVRFERGYALGRSVGFIPQASPDLQRRESRWGW